MRLRSFLISLLLLASAAFAAGPEFPAYTGFVNDFAGVLDAATVQKLEGLCRTLEQKTSAELAIAVVKTVAPLDPKTYAVKLFEKWKIGKKSLDKLGTGGKDNGILMLLTMEERRVEIEVGYGLEGVINDARAGEILDKYIVPFFKQGKFGEGLYNGAAAIAGEIARASGEDLGEKYRATEEKEFPVMLVIIGAILLLMFLSIFASGLASGLVGTVVGAAFGFTIAGIIGAVLGALIGFVLSYTRLPGTGKFGGGWGGFGGGGFEGGGGGFGGGGSGGGGAGRSW